MSHPRLPTIWSAQEASNTAATASEKHPLNAKSIGTATRPGGGTGRLIRGIDLLDIHCSVGPRPRGGGNRAPERQGCTMLNPMTVARSAEPGLELGGGVTPQRADFLPGCGIEQVRSHREEDLVLLLDVAGQE